MSGGFKFRPATERVPEMSDGRRRCYDLLCEWAFGSHHLYNFVADFGVNGLCYSHSGELATFDGSDLTRLVLLAHQHRVRIGVEPGGPQRLRITLFPRAAEGHFHERHPSLADLIPKGEPTP